MNLWFNMWSMHNRKWLGLIHMHIRKDSDGNVTKPDVTHWFYIQRKISGTRVCKDIFKECMPQQKLNCYFKHFNGYLSCKFHRKFLLIYSSTRHEYLCGISTKELMQCVLLINYNCLWNKLCVAITTVTNRTLKRVRDSTHPCNFPSYLGMHAVNHLLHHYAYWTTSN